MLKSVRAEGRSIAEKVSEWLHGAELLAGVKPQQRRREEEV